MLRQLGLDLYAIPSTADILEKHDVSCKSVDVSALTATNHDKLVDFLQSGVIDMIVSVPGLGRINVAREGYHLRRLAVDLEISLITDISLAKSAVAAISKYQLQNINISSWKDFLQTRRYRKLQAGAIA